MPCYIDYQATTFGHHYSFEWHSRFDDISAQNSPLQRARFLTATSMLGPVPNQGFNHVQGCLAYQASLYILQAYLPLHQVGETHFFPELR